MLMLCCTSCSEQTSAPEEPNQAQLIAGTWTLTSTVDKGKTTKALDHQKRIIIKEDGAFELLVRTKDRQDWSTFGTGVLFFRPPLLTFYWNSGAEETLTITEREANRIVLRVGQSFAPTKDLHPDEIYERTSTKSNPSES